MPSPFRAGDIVACFGTCPLSRAISLGTASPFAPAGLRIGPSHVALIVPHQGKLRWSESTSLTDRDCLLQKRRVNGWQLHEIDDRIADYTAAGGRVDVYRLHPYYEFDVPETLDLARWSIDYWLAHCATYDRRNALFAGSRLVRLLKLYKPADLAALFCSEYIAAVLRRMNRLSADENPSRFSPARLLRELTHSGTYQFHRSLSGRWPRLQLHQSAA